MRSYFEIQTREGCYSAVKLEIDRYDNLHIFQEEDSEKADCVADLRNVESVSFIKC